MEASDAGNSQADMSPSVALMIHVVPIIGKASYIWIDLQAGAETRLGPDNGGGSGEMASKAWIDPVFSFDQAAFDEEADSMGFPPFNLSDYFTFTTGPSSSGTNPNGHLYAGHAGDI